MPKTHTIAKTERVESRATVRHLGVSPNKATSGSRGVYQFD